MDGISVAASIVGLIGAAAKVVVGLNEVFEFVNEEPKVLVRLRNEVSDTSVCLKQIQAILLDSAAVPTSNSSVLMVEDIVVVLSNCVLIFSELEATVDTLKRDHINIFNRTYTYITKKETFTTLLARLQSSKVSLNLALSAMTCSSIGEARTCVSQLTRLVHDVLESNRHISERLAFMETKLSGNRSVESRSIVDSTLETEKIDDNESMLTMQQRSIRRMHNTKRFPGIQVNDFESDLEASLYNSRPYIRASKPQQLEFSANCSTTRSIGWSFLSGISLAEVSNISVIELAINRNALWNSERYTIGQNQAIEALQAAFSEDEQSKIPPWTMVPIFVNTSAAALVWKRCSKCRKSLTDRTEDLVFPALGFSSRVVMFHHKLWHEGCFKCTSCASSILVGAHGCHLASSNREFLVCDLCLPRCKECGKIIPLTPISDLRYCSTCKRRGTSKRISEDPAEKK